MKLKKNYSKKYTKKVKRYNSKTLQKTKKYNKNKYNKNKYNKDKYNKDKYSKNKSYKIRGGVKKRWQFWKSNYYDAPLTPEDINYAECEVCSEFLSSKLIQLPCGHVFHETDVQFMNKKCPLDSIEINGKLIHLPENAYIKEGDRNNIAYR